MRRFRRSKGDKESTPFSTSAAAAAGASRNKFANISVPLKDAAAIQAPKKVIKALYDYQNPGEEDYYLSFNQGDFLHVVGREDDPDWYEACNPIHGVRGLVPVNYFEVIGKQQQQQHQLFHERGDNILAVKDQQSATGHDSGFAEPDQSSFSDNTSNPTSSSLPRVSMGRGTGAMVYGIVQYDFTAERPDELDAKAGEAIIVIAQSNAEWFVAKPITRLGGPGLIPVSFIEIRDMSTGQAVPDTAEAVARAGVPKVEEWKRMAADYKNSSIPLGQVSAPHGQPPPGTMSANGQTRSSREAKSGHTRSGSQLASTPQYEAPPHVRTSQLLAPVRARVLSFHHRQGDFWFDVDVTMEDGRMWNLERNYKDFYGLQLSLIEQFPEVAGKIEGYQRTLPYIPGPLPWVTAHVTSERRGKLDQYMINLLKMNTAITNSQTVRTFFYPREYDSEKTGDDEAGQTHGEDEEDEGARLSGGSNPSLSQPQPYEESSSMGAGGGGGGGGGGGSPPPHQPRLSSLQSQQAPSKAPGGMGHQRDMSDHLRVQGGHPPMLRNNSNLTTGSGASTTNTNGNSSQAAAAAKIKVWFSDSTCVVIRLPASFGYSELLTKLRDRYSLEPGVERERAHETEFVIDYKDEASGGGYFKLNGDEDLEIARQRNDKLTLKVQAIPAM